MNITQFFKPLKKWWKLVVFIIILLAAAGFWFYRSTQAQQQEYTFISPEHENLTKTLEISGVVDASEKAQLRFAGGGKVTYIGAEEGEQVKQGQTIAVIDRATLQKQMQQDLNNYMKERWDFEQEKDDAEEEDIDDRLQRTLDKNQWDLENEVIDVEIRDIAIRNTVLAAPFDGILTSSPTSVAGVTLLASDAFEVVNPETLVFIGRVDEADIGLVSEGQMTAITLDAFTDQSFDTHVDDIAFTSNETATGTSFDVEFPLSQVANRELLRLGMNGDANIVLDERSNVMSIPIIATRQRDGNIYVDVRTGENTVEERQIEVGLETEEKYEVLGGLAPDEQIVLPD